MAPCTFKFNGQLQCVAVDVGLADLLLCHPFSVPVLYLVLHLHVLMAFSVFVVNVVVACLLHVVLIRLLASAVAAP